MAIIGEIDQEAWSEWIDSRPKIIQDICKKLPPNRLYRMKSTGQRVYIYSYSEDGTVTVDITGQYNFITFDRQVFGIDPDNLEECDLPDDNEPLGTMLTEEDDVRDFVDSTLKEDKHIDNDGQIH